MNTAVINIKINPQVKKDAQKLAEDLGFSLSSLINGYLKQIIRTKSVNFNLTEEPSEYMIKALKESRADIKAGRVISFKKPNDALDYLDKLIADEKKSRQT
ncbi:type II toxin-antitoxin system RelB/DinJ family antitoxin [Candidatus Daviesbacteria bacterium]|nr:type II toxin-antitoxin system RelB/DinJ family antitoxin [Candidatus Daviesbacteria bacterium]